MNTPSKIDTEFEFSWYMDTIVFKPETKALESKTALYQLFLGAMRIVFDYKWLPECKGFHLQDISISNKINMEEQGKRINEKCESLGKWTMYIICSTGVTQASSLESIERDMERFIRARFDIKAPEGLSVIKQDYERKHILSLFTGIEG